MIYSWFIISHEGQPCNFGSLKFQDWNLVIHVDKLPSKSLSAGQNMSGPVTSLTSVSESKKAQPSQPRPVHSSNSLQRGETKIQNQVNQNWKKKKNYRRPPDRNKTTTRRNVNMPRREKQNRRTHYRLCCLPSMRHMPERQTLRAQNLPTYSGENGTYETWRKNRNTVTTCLNLEVIVLFSIYLFICLFIYFKGGLLQMLSSSYMKYFNWQVRLHSRVTAYKNITNICLLMCRAVWC